jgi:hypothetical protein
MNPKIVILLLTWVSLAWSEEAKFTPPPAGINGWPNKEYDKVVGYQFANPEETSFIKDDALNLEKLTGSKRKESALSNTQTNELLKATFEADLNGSGLMCYNPHHIIVFYSDDKPVAAIEICFQCSGVRTWPDHKARWWHTSFNDLAKLTTALGLGTSAPAADKTPAKSGQQRFPVR